MSKETAMLMEYNGMGIFFSLILTFSATYLAVELCDQYRLRLTKELQDNGFMPCRYSMPVLMAVCLGGAGVWCMQVLWTSTMTFRYEGSSMDLAHDPVYLSASLVVALVTTFIGVVAAAQDSIFIKTKAEITELLVSDASELPLHRARRMHSLSMLRMLSLRSPQCVLLGGSLAGSGYVVSSYLAVKAMVFSANTQIDWHSGRLVAMSIITVACSMLTFWMMFRLLPLCPSFDSLRWLCAAIMTAGLSSLCHLDIEAAAVHCSEEQSGDNFRSAFSKDSVLDGVEMAAVAVLLLIGIFVIRTLRRLATRRSAYLPSGDGPSFRASYRYSSQRTATNIKRSQTLPDTVTDDGKPSSDLA